MGARMCHAGCATKQDVGVGMNGFNFSDLLITIAAFVVAIVILVGAHEWGHFWVARRLGIRVLRFSIGIGKPVWKRVSKKDGVEYVISAIPLGGYVKLLGERNEEDEPIAPQDLPYSFHQAAVWKRVLVLLAGPTVNLVLAAFIYWILLMVGIPAFKPVVGEVVNGSSAMQAGLQKGDLITAVHGHDVATEEDALMYLVSQSSEGMIDLSVRGENGTGAAHLVTITTNGSTDWSRTLKLSDALGFDFWKPGSPPDIQELEPGGAAAQAGMRLGDVIVSVDNQTINDFGSLIKVVGARPNRTVEAKVRRGDQVLTLPIAIREQVIDGQHVGKIGVGVVPPALRTMQKYGPVSGVKWAVVKTWDACALDLKVIGQMLTGKLSVKNLSGTVGIAQATGQAARQGLLTFIALLAFISINLGILNLLPIPMLDGGQVVYQLIELVKGSPVSERVQLIAQQVGIAALIMLVSLTLYNDIARTLS